MADDPFKDPIDLKHYLVLMSATKDNAAMIQKILRNLQTGVDSRAAPLWIDSKGIGVFVASDLPAIDIHAAMFDAAIKGEFGDSRDALVVELGRDWIGSLDAKYAHWLTTHLGIPRQSERRQRKPR